MGGTGIGVRSITEGRDTERGRRRGSIRVDRRGDKKGKKRKREESPRRSIGNRDKDRRKMGQEMADLAGGVLGMMTAITENPSEKAVPDAVAQTRDQIVTDLGKTGTSLDATTRKERILLSENSPKKNSKRNKNWKQSGSLK